MEKIEKGMQKKKKKVEKFAVEKYRLPRRANGRIGHFEKDIKQAVRIDKRTLEVIPLASKPKAKKVKDTLQLVRSATLHFAGTETEGCCSGHMSGAVVAGERVADEVLKVLEVDEEREVVVGVGVKNEKEKKEEL